MAILKAAVASVGNINEEKAFTSILKTEMNDLCKGRVTSYNQSFAAEVFRMRDMIKEKLSVILKNLRSLVLKARQSDNFGTFLHQHPELVMYMACGQVLNTITLMKMGVVS